MSASSGGSKTQSEFLNLTPFIDLFSVLIIFLIMTAVWNQIEALSTNVENVTSSSEPPPDPLKKKVVLSVTILPDRIEMAEDDTSSRVNYLGTEIDMNGIIGKLNEWRQKYPDRNDIILNTANSIPYKHMIGVFDTLVGSGWPDVGVNTQ